MINGLDFIEYLEQYGKTEDYSWDELASEYNLKSGNAARKLWQRHRENTLDRIEDTFPETNSSYIDRVKGEAKATFISNEEALSDAQIHEQCKMDSKKWLLTQVWQNNKGGKFSYSANFKLIPADNPTAIEEIFTNVLKNYKSSYIPSSTPIIVNKKYLNPTCCLIALTDVHLDKQTLDEQTIESKIESYHRVLDMLIYKTYTSNLVDEIVFTIGHDLFNTDTYFNTTTNGTQQFNNSEWDKSYELVFDSQVAAINKLKQFCNTLYIKYIPSNHARTKEYFLVHALAIYFKGDKNIIFDRDSSSTKVHIFGENFIGMHHGDTKLEKLPLYFSQKYYKEWGMAKYKSICVGDKHFRKSMEMDGVRVYQTPHMGGYGQWDKSMMFENGIQSGICMVFDKQRGRIMEIEEII